MITIKVLVINLKLEFTATDSDCAIGFTGDCTVESTALNSYLNISGTCALNICLIYSSCTVECTAVDYYFNRLLCSVLRNCKCRISNSCTVAVCCSCNFSVTACNITVIECKLTCTDFDTGSITLYRTAVYCGICISCEIHACACTCNCCVCQSNLCIFNNAVYINTGTAIARCIIYTIQCCAFDIENHAIVISSSRCLVNHYACPTFKCNTFLDVDNRVIFRALSATLDYNGSKVRILFLDCTIACYCKFSIANADKLACSCDCNIKSIQSQCNLLAVSNSDYFCHFNIRKQCDCITVLSSSKCFLECRELN